MDYIYKKLNGHKLFTGLFGKRLCHQFLTDNKAYVIIRHIVKVFEILQTFEDTNMGGRPFDKV